MPTFNYSSANDLAVRLRQRFQTATKLEALNIASQLALLTDTQLKALFSLTTAQTTSLRTKLTNMVALRDQIKTQAGQ